MNGRKITCDDSQLDVLLSDDEESDEFRQMAAHIETCDHCRDRLTDLAADVDEWDEVSSLLREYDGSDDDNVKHHIERSDAAKLDLGFLAPPSHPETLGRLGRYEIERVIGHGGMGVVLKGYDAELNRPVAIKVLDSSLAHSGAARQRFAREGRAAAAVVHEHVVAIHNVETDVQTPFLVMQYVPGPSLQTRVDHQGPLSAPEILRIGTQAADALSAAHAQGVVHRDIKPSNILLESDVERALLTDFGLARAADDATVTRTGVVAGTPHYMSPEQASGATVDERSDLFSLGASLYFMATGHPPFRAERPLAVLNRICHDRQRPVWEVNPEIPIELSDLIDRLLEKKPHRRFTSAAQARDALLKLLEKLQQPRIARRQRLRRWFRRHRWNVGVTTAALVAIAVLALGAMSQFGSPNLGESPDREAAEGHDNRTDGEVPASNADPAGAYAAELADTERDLIRIEAANSAEGAHFLHTGRTGWHAELELLDQRLTKTENSLTNKPQSLGAE